MERQSNIEILRIIATMMVILVHTAFLSLGIPRQFDSSGLMICTLQIFAVPAVNIFVLISGYFQIRPKVKNFSNYLFQILFYSISIYVLWLMLGRSQLSLIGIKECFFLTDANWFIKSYLLLFIISPLLNAFIDNSSKQTHRIIILSMLVYQTIFDFVSMADLSIRNGYSTMSFILLYLIGSYIRRFGGIGIRKMKVAILGVSLYCIMLLPIIASYLGILDAKYAHKFLQYGLAYSNPLIMGVAVCYLLFFLQFNVTSKLVNWFAISSFAAFLIHANPNVIRVFIAFVNNVYVSSSLLSYVTIIIVFVICVFIGSVLVDKIRMFLWKQFWKQIEKKYGRKKA